MDEHKNIYPHPEIPGQVGNDTRRFSLSARLTLIAVR